MLTLSLGLSAVSGYPGVGHFKQAGIRDAVRKGMHLQPTLQCQ